ncbi:MAG: cell wall hydrolase [Parasporobacterium sp.]|nr:cell wall hydrolase [Parasporobacterium sp.]
MNIRGFKIAYFIAIAILSISVFVFSTYISKEVEVEKAAELEALNLAVKTAEAEASAAQKSQAIKKQILSSKTIIALELSQERMNELANTPTDEPLGFAVTDNTFRPVNNGVSVMGIKPGEDEQNMNGTAPPEDWKSLKETSGNSSTESSDNNDSDDYQDDDYDDYYEDDYYEPETEAPTEAYTEPETEPVQDVNIGVTPGDASHSGYNENTFPGGREAYILACCVSAEVGWSPYETQNAVANIILDRAASAGSIEAAVYAPGQFSVTWNGAMDAALREGPRTTAAQAAMDALAGIDVRPRPYYYFNNAYMGYTGEWIGNEYFYLVD